MCFNLSLAVEESSDACVGVVARHDEARFRLGARSLAHSRVDGQLIVVWIRRNVVFQRNSTPLRATYHRTINKSTYYYQQLSALEVGRYFENIVDVSPISIYRYWYRIGTLNIVFFRHIDIVSVTSEISVNFRYFIVLFSDVLTLILTTDNHTTKIEYLIWQCGTSLHLVTSLLVRNGS